MDRPPSLLVLVNAQSGTSHKFPASDLVRRISDGFALYGIAARVEVVEPKRLHERSRAARRKAEERDVDAVVAGGGDGTIRAVAEELAGTSVPLGVLPLGTLNHFAKDLGLPMDLEGAIGIIASQGVKAVDVAEVNGSIFINNSSIGIYPYMVLDRERRRRKSGIAKWLAMMLAVLRTWRYLPVRRMWIELSNGNSTCRTPCVFVGNNAYDVGPLAHGRRPRLDEGLLWLCVSRQDTRLALLWLAVRALFGRVQPMRDIEVHTVSRAAIRTRTTRLAVAMDGEVRIMRPPLHFRTRPGELIVYAPAGATQR